MFSLDNISGSAADGYQYASNYRSSGASVTAAGSTGYKAALDAGLDRFTTTFRGGFDGYDITERDPSVTLSLALRQPQRKYFLPTIFFEKVN